MTSSKCTRPYRPARSAAGLLCAAAMLCSLILALPSAADAIWPFSKGKPYLVKVGEETITKEEFLKEIKLLHMSGRVGKAMSEETSFAPQDYSKFLDELIDKKLMYIEAKNHSLDKESYFVNTFNNYAMNLFLDKLRQEVVLDKVKVEDAEIAERFAKKLKDEAEKGKAAEKDKDKKPEDAAPKEGDKQAADKPREITTLEREELTKLIFNEKAKEAEARYFEGLRAAGNVLVHADALEAMALDKPETLDKAVAEAGGAAITGKELAGWFRGGHFPEDPSARRQVLDRFIINRLLDDEAQGRRYEEKDDDIKRKLKRYREGLLAELFQRKVIAPQVNVDDAAVSEYYNANKESFRQDDSVDIGFILFEDEKTAMSALEDLKKGADFAYLAGKHSKEPTSAKKGGNMGWVQTKMFSKDVQEGLYKARKGDMLGPYHSDDGVALIEFRGLKKGEYFPIEDMKGMITNTLANDKYQKRLLDYMKRLRETVPVDINEKELANLKGV